MQGEDGECEGDHPAAPLLTIRQPPCTYILTRTGEGEVMCAEPILHLGQGERGVSQEVVTGTAVGQRSGKQPVRAVLQGSSQPGGGGGWGMPIAQAPCRKLACLPHRGGSRHLLHSC